MDVSSRSFSASDLAAFSLLHQRHLGGRVFAPTDYGACSMPDLLEAAMASACGGRGGRSVIRVVNGRVFLCAEMEDFVRNAIAVLESAEGHTIDTDAFDKAYTADYGCYIVPDLGFSCLSALFAEFSRDLQLVDSGGRKTTAANPAARLSLSRRRKVALLGRDLSQLLERAPGRTIK